MREYRPDAQLRWHADAASRFPWEEAYARRMQKTLFNPRSFRALRTRIRTTLAEHPDDPRARKALAWTTLQNRVTRGQLDEVRDTLSGLRRDDEVRRLDEVVDQLDDNGATNRPRHVPSRVNWSVTNSCPMICKGCYNVFTERELDLPEALHVVDSLARAGVRAVMLSGGDPLLWEPLVPVLAALQARGLKVGLDTTGHPELRTRLSEALPYVDTLGIPLDGVRDDTARRFRRGAGTDLVASTLDLLERTDLPLTRIHTVVTRWNAGELPELLDLLERRRNAAEWALYQFWPRRIGESQVARMTLSPEEFAAATAGLSPRRIEMFTYPYPERAFMNAMILATGEVVTFGERPGEEFMAGSLLDADPAEVFAMPAVRQSKLVRSLVAGSAESGFIDEPYAREPSPVGA